MSRRPVDRAAQNLVTLKTLVKLESNKSCADCKRNKREYLKCSRIPVTDTELLQIQDGQAGIWVSSSVYGEDFLVLIKNSD